MNAGRLMVPGYRRVLLKLGGEMFGGGGVGVDPEVVKAVARQIADVVAPVRYPHELPVEQAATGREEVAVADMGVAVDDRQGRLVIELLERGERRMNPVEGMGIEVDGCRLVRVAL